MGNSRRRRLRFLADRPRCCICGGLILAVEEDHYPPKAIFYRQQWPEGYRFPACRNCNHSTNEDENLIALLCRSYPAPKTRDEQAELDRIRQGIRERMPEVFRSFSPARAEKRVWTRERGDDFPTGMQQTEIEEISIEHPRIQEAIGRFATKLFCCLYYMHTGNILPRTGWIVFRWHTNSHEIDEVIPEDLADSLNAFPSLVRQNTSLTDQFSYLFAVSRSNQAAVFQVFFRDSLALLGMVFDHLPDAVIDKVRDSRSAILLQPFAW